MAAALAQYLERYAAAESKLAEQITERYHSVLCVPAFRESPDFIAQYAQALAAAPGRVLVIVVVNAASPRAAEAWPEHEALLSALRRAPVRQLSAAPPAWLSSRARYDVLALDRASPEFCFGPREGVGLARRLGCDLALALFAAGKLESPWLHCTDADASLAADYFTADPAVPSTVSARLFGFWHACGAGGQVARATAVYEIRLRYYVLSLARAGSPYAFHAIGSTLALRADAYAAVRGFPKRLAGEDFYLLNKLVKVGPLWRTAGISVELESRASLRTAFGTGVATAQILESGHEDAALLYDPQSFALLAIWLGALGQLAESGEVGAVWARLRSELGPRAPLVLAALQGLGAEEELARAVRETTSAEARARHLHTWFDGFRTLKFVHALRASGLPSLPWRDALHSSGLLTELDVKQAAPDAVRNALWLEEKRLPRLVGPTLSGA